MNQPLTQRLKMPHVFKRGTWFRSGTLIDESIKVYTVLLQHISTPEQGNRPFYKLMGWNSIGESKELLLWETDVVGYVKTGAWTIDPAPVVKDKKEK